MPGCVLVPGQLPAWSMLAGLCLAVLLFWWQTGGKRVASGSGPGDSQLACSRYKQLLAGWQVTHGWATGPDSHHTLASGGPVARYGLTHSPWVAIGQLLGRCWQACAGCMQPTRAFGKSTSHFEDLQFLDLHQQVCGVAGGSNAIRCEVIMLSMCVAASWML